MGRRTCSVDSCGREGRVVRGFCLTHYERWRKHGDPHVVLPRGAQATPCRADGCTEKGAEGFGYCRPHYKRFRRYGDPLGQPAEYVRPTCSCDGCEKPAKARGLCDTHYQRLRQTGSTEPRPRLSAWESVQRRLVPGAPGECWEWPGARGGHLGHGQVWDAQIRRVLYVPRVVWEQSNGRELAPDEVVRHRCDNPPCANPAHLVVGDMQANTDDMVERGRGWWQNGEPGKRGKTSTPEKRARDAARKRELRAARRLTLAG